jgi:hypothetical protein
MYSRKLYATGSATANGAATITVPSASRLIAVQWAVVFGSTTNAAFCRLEISAASATEIAVNEAQQCISELDFYGNFVTSGLSNGGANLFVPVPGVPWAQGQKIYLHAVISGTVTFTGGAVLWFA